MTLQTRLTVACVAALVALGVYTASGAKVAYYALWLPTAAVALYYLTIVAIRAVKTSSGDARGENL